MSLAASPENPRFTAIGPGEHHLAVALGELLEACDVSYLCVIDAR